MDLDDEHSWTTVVRRRGRAFQHYSSAQSSISHSQFPISPCYSADNSTSQAPRKRGALAAAPAEAPDEGDQDDDDDESRVLLRMKRSMLRVQESNFFRRFLDQTASPPVLDNLRRAAAPLPRLEYTQDCTSFERTVCTGDKQRKCDGDMASESCVDCGSQVFASVKGMASGTSSTERFAPRSTHKNSEASLKLENSSSVTSDRDGEFAIAARVEGKHKPPDPTGLLLEPSRKEELAAGISVEHWQLQIVVYGLGKIADSEVSRCQFALVLLLKQSFPWIGGIEIYDPILSQSECRVIRGLGCSSIAINEEGRRSIERPTVFYMPHCEDWLYDNVLQANWTPLKLSQLVILGNSFRSYQQRWSSFPGTRSKPPPTYVLELQQTAQEIPLEATSSLELPAFNNLSWHFFPGSAS